LSLDDPPDVFGPIGRLAYEVPAGIQERLGRLHLGRRFARASDTRRQARGLLVPEAGCYSTPEGVPVSHQPTNGLAVSDWPYAVAVVHSATGESHQPADLLAATDLCSAIGLGYDPTCVISDQSAHMIVISTDCSGAVALSHRSSVPPHEPASTLSAGADHATAVALVHHTPRTIVPHQPADRLGAADCAGAVAPSQRASVPAGQPADPQEDPGAGTGYVDLHYTEVLDLGPGVTRAEEARRCVSPDRRMRDRVTIAVKDAGEALDDGPIEESPAAKVGVQVDVGG